ncbi:MAG TPA: VIT domain-containing protein, partial [Polyangiaceae bacterium]
MSKEDEPRANETRELAPTVSEVIARDARSLARFVAASVGAGPDADALSRDVIVASFQAFSRGDQDALGRPRLFALARKRAALHVEHQRRRTGPEESRGAGPRALIAAVRPTEREALLLRYVADLPIGDVALAAGTDEITVRQRISRALCHLSAVERGPSVASEPAEVAAMRRRVEDRLADVLDGLAPDDVADFVADDDQARDLVHDAERMVETVRGMGSDHATDLSSLAGAVEMALNAEGSGTEVPAAASAGEAIHEEPAPVPAGTGAASAAAVAPPGAAAPGGARESTATALEGAAPIGGAAGSTATATVHGATSGSTTEGVDARPSPPERTPERATGTAENRPLVERLGARGRLAVIGGAALMLGGIMFAVSRSGSAGRHGGDAWSGKVDRVSLAFGGQGGLERCSPDRAVCSPIEGGDDVPAGSTLRTDGRTRAVVLLADGTRIALDRESELRLDGDLPRRARLDHGSAVVEVSDLSASSGNRARIDVPLGFVESVAAKLSLSVVPQRVAIEVVRGSARLVDAQERGVAVHAGEAGRLEPGRPPEVASTAYLGGAFRWNERAFGDPGQTEDITGLGELRAKKVGQDGERKGAVVLASHSTKVRIVGNVARTEVEEEFSNQAADVLEGIFRFPLPADAQIERLALDVDGKMVDGAFVDRDRASAIWRGAIVNAGEKRKPDEEIVWVPGPWRDPALLEWQRGGRFELRIYPIPEHGSRRVILAYTQVIPPDGEVRRYVYPLPHDPSGSTRVGRFDMDVQVRGHDVKSGVRPQGYAVRHETLPDGADSFTLHAESFSPSGDLSLEFALPDAGREVTAWAYQPGPDDPAGPTGGTGLAGAGDPYVALALRPKLPLVTDGAHRSFALIVDSSRSMFGERYHRATELVTRIVREMNRDDIATVLACDSMCREIPSGPASGGPELAHAVSEFLTSVTPEGGSDVTGAIAHAREALRSAAHGTARIVYVGDGTPTI